MTYLERKAREVLYVLGIEATPTRIKSTKDALRTLFHDTAKEAGRVPARSGPEMRMRDNCQDRVLALADRETPESPGADMTTRPSTARKPAYPGQGHPWADFLDARARVLEMWSTEGKTPEQMAHALSMDATQVRLILLSRVLEKGLFGESAAAGGGRR